jgi:hypothetical protein
MQGTALTQLNEVYSQIENNTAITAVVTALETAKVPLSLDELTNKQKNKNKEAYSFNDLFENTAALAYALEDVERQDYMLNRILFPLIFRTGVTIKKNGEVLKHTPAVLQEFFKAIDEASPLVEAYHVSRYVFLRKIIPSPYSATCAAVRLIDMPSHIYAEGKVQLRAYKNQTPMSLKFVCPDIKPFPTEANYYKKYNAIDMKLIKGDSGELTLKNWAIGFHPDRPANTDNQLCLLGVKDD